MKLLLIVIIFLISLGAYSSEEIISNFAIGSCNKQDRPQPMWNIIRSHKPQLFVWAGDSIYANTNSESVMRKKYKTQQSVDDYIQLKKEVPIIGTWDDHDFGQNNTGKNYLLKKISQKLFLDFVNEPLNSKRRSQEGIYTSYEYGQMGKKIKIILLDTRYHRDDLKTKNGDILGEKQWEWLERELKASKAQINFILSSYSVLARKSPFNEEWADFPYAKKKLFSLIQKYNPSGLLFLTGDRHFSAYLGKKYGGKEYHELMVSGLTHSYKSKALRFALNRFYGKENTYFGLNFGQIKIDWFGEKKKLEFNIYDTNNNLGLQKIFELNRSNWVKM